VHVPQILRCTAFFWHDVRVSKHGKKVAVKIKELGCITSIECHDRMLHKGAERERRLDKLARQFHHWCFTWKITGLERERIFKWVLN